MFTLFKKTFIKEFPYPTANILQFSEIDAEQTPLLAFKIEYKQTDGGFSADNLNYKIKF